MNSKARVTLVCAGLNLALAAVKIVAGLIGQSQALVADGIHSLSDLISDAMVLVAVRFSSQEADEDHPYGHARFETIATVALGVLLMLVAFGLVSDAAGRLADPDTLLQPGWLALAVAVVSILANEWMYWYTLRVAKETNSELMRANAWHHRTDAISSVIVLVGVAGSMMGYAMLDAIGAIGVALLIAKIAWDLLWSSAKELVDTGVGPDELAEIAGTISSVEGVESFHDLRTRRMGHSVLLEVHILVGSQVTVSEGHMIGDRVREHLHRRHESISQVLVHIDPEDDESEAAATDLPDRQQLLRTLRDCWAPLGLNDSIEKINLHYLRGAVTVEVVLPLHSVAMLEEASGLAERLRQAAGRIEQVATVDVLYSVGG